MTALKESITFCKNFMGDELQKISRITGHPVKNKENIGNYFFLGF